MIDLYTAMTPDGWKASGEKRMAVIEWRPTGQTRED
jgi:hypothetical protein